MRPLPVLVKLLVLPWLLACDHEPPGVEKHAPGASAESVTTVPLAGPADLETTYLPADDRKDLWQLPPESQYRELAKATAALVESDKLTPSGDIWKASFQRFGEARSLCPTEPYRQQPVVSFCSGVLVAPNIVATAAHCFTDAGQRPENIAFVFGFAVEKKGAFPTEFPAENVFHGRRLVGSSPPTEEDWALIELDRPAERLPAPLRKTGRANKGDAVYVIGHPAGLPLKVADGAKVRGDDGPKRFFADLDTYVGNSGSPVYGPTHEVEGLLIRGGVDFEFEGHCRRARTCSSMDCPGEVVMRTANFLSSVPPA